VISPITGFALFDKFARRLVNLAELANGCIHAQSRRAFGKFNKEDVSLFPDKVTRVYPLGV
jgi:hypothetical protein